MNGSDDLHFFEGRERRRLFYQQWMSRSHVKAHVIGLHDLASHSDRFKLIADYLTEKGYAFHALDLRGHYRSKGEIAGEIDSMDHLEKDLVLFLDFLKNQEKNEKFFILGHGFGALIGLMYAIRHPDLPGIIACAPDLGTVKKIKMGKKLVKKISNRLSQSISWEINQNLLTSDLKILKQFIKDKNVLTSITLNTASEKKKMQKWVLSREHMLECPILILLGGNDKIVDGKKIEHFFNNIKSPDKTLKKYEGFLHDLLNEKNRAQVFQDIHVWLEKHA
ncbi:MAG: lysophospholipase [Promethearchaeota archaeon]